VAESDGSIGVALSVIACFPKLDDAVATGVGKGAAGTGITVVGKSGVVKSGFTDFIERTLDDAIAARAAFEEAGSGAAIAVAGVCVVTLFTGLHNAVAADRGKGDEGSGGRRLAGTVPAHGSLRALRIGAARGSDLALVAHADRAIGTLIIRYAGNGWCAGTTARTSAALRIVRTPFLFKGARRAAAVTGCGITVITPLGRFEQTVAAEGIAEDFAFGHAGGGAAVTVTAVTVIAELSGVHAAVAALRRCAVRPSVAEIIAFSEGEDTCGTVAGEVETVGSGGLGGGLRGGK